MSVLMWTVRDFAKAREGKEFLRRHFDFSKFPAPKLGPPVALPQGADVNVVGTAFDILLPLLIHRQNKKSIDRKAPGFYWLTAKEVRGFTKSTILHDSLLDAAIKKAIEGHKSFSWSFSAGRLRPNQSMRRALRALAELAESLAWEGGNFSHRTALCSFAILDLWLDGTAIDIKTVKDAGHHSEHTAQLLSYHLLSRLPAVLKDGVVIDRIGVYYARHGVLATTGINDLHRSAKQNTDAVAAQFYESFIRWAVDKRYEGEDSSFKSAYLKQQLKLGLFSAGLGPGRRASRETVRS